MSENETGARDLDERVKEISDKRDKVAAKVAAENGENETLKARLAQLEERLEKLEKRLQDKATKRNARNEEDASSEPSAA